MQQSIGQSSTDAHQQQVSDLEEQINRAPSENFVLETKELTDVEEIKNYI